jgi:non-canonical (house-cleaning) NTP pyrophosphatase
LASGADFWVGLEGGVEDGPLGMAAFAWAAVRGPDGLIGRGKTGMFFLPPGVADLIRAGRELGEADDIVFGRTNSKQANGAVGILTGDAIDRAAYYATAVTLALIPFKNQPFYVAAEPRSSYAPAKS